MATAPTAPGSFTVGSPSTSTLSLSWASSTPNNGATVSFYAIQRGTSTSTLPQIATTSALSYGDAGLATSTTYFYYVGAQDSVGNVSASSSIASSTTLSGITPTISSFAASSSIVLSAGTSTLSWNVSNASSVAITPGSFSTSTLIGSTTVNPTSTILFTLTATNGNGTSTATTSVTIDSTPPTIPSSLAAAGTGTSTISLTWASSTDNVSVAGYTIYRGSSSGTLSEIATTTNLSYDNIGLSANATYWYAVAAYDEVGNTSGESSSTSATTQAAASSGGGGGGFVSVASSYGCADLVCATSPASSSFAFIPTSSSTLTASLSAELQTLEAELLSVEKEAVARGIAIPPSGTASSYHFTRDLLYLTTGSDVQELQRFLIDQNAGPAAEKLKAHGTTRTFGIMTYYALKEYQKGVGLPATGYFGAMTRAYIKSHYNAQVIQR